MSNLKNIANITALAAASMAVDPMYEMRNIIRDPLSDFDYNDLIRGVGNRHASAVRARSHGKKNAADPAKKKARKAQGKARAKNRMK